MITTSQELKKQIHGLWPGIRIITADRSYWLPSESKVKDLVWESYIDKYRHTVELFDCDDFALVLHAFVVQERYKQMEERKLPKEEWLPWPFGEIWGMKFNGRKLDHAINFCITKTGVLLIEPQNDKSWIADPDNDNAYLCRM